MFAEEARVAGLLTHPNVVGVLDVGEDLDGPFLVMAYISGLTLGELMACASDQGYELPVSVACQVTLQLARALRCVHTATDTSGAPLGLVHRDVSPKNVLVGFDGSVRLTDFGIARAADRAIATTMGLLKGTPGYVAPERLRFETPDLRADLFSLGIVLYELLAGERLYSDHDPRRIVDEPAPDIGELRTDVPSALTELLFELLAKAPDARPRSASAVETRLVALCAELEVAEAPVTIEELVSIVAADVAEEREARVRQALERAAKPAPASPGLARRGWLAAGLVLGLGALGAGLAAHGATEPAAPVESVAAPPEPAAPEAAPTVREPQPAPPVRVPEPPERASTPPATPEATAEATPEPPPRRRPRRARRSERASGPTAAPPAATREAAPAPRRADSFPQEMGWNGDLQ